MSLSHKAQPTSHFSMWLFSLFFTTIIFIYQLPQPSLFIYRAYPPYASLARGLPSSKIYWAGSLGRRIDHYAHIHTCQIEEGTQLGLVATQIKVTGNRKKIIHKIANKLKKQADFVIEFLFQIPYIRNTIGVCRIMSGKLNIFCTLVHIFYGKNLLLDLNVFFSSLLFKVSIFANLHLLSCSPSTDISQRKTQSLSLILNVWLGCTLPLQVRCTGWSARMPGTSVWSMTGRRRTVLLQTGISQNMTAGWGLSGWPPHLFNQ